MIPQNSLVLLDTNVLVLLARAKAPGRQVNADYQLAARAETPLISIVTVGECFALARKFGWGAKKTSALTALLHKLVVVDISRPAVLEAYAELDAFAIAKGRTIGKNDIWIAATTVAAAATLITTDKDFLPLREAGLSVEYVDQATLPTGD